MPGHVHLKDLGQPVAGEIARCGGVAREFIANSVEYMVNAHCADALVCISNFDNLTSGMLMAAMCLNIPTVFVSGGPMETGRVELPGHPTKIDGVVNLVAMGRPGARKAEIDALERAACPTCGSWSGTFTATP